MKGIDLPILFHTEGTLALSDLDIDVSEDELQWLPVTFYAIDCIHESITDERRSIVYANGICYTCNMSYSDLREKINQA